MTDKSHSAPDAYLTAEAQARVQIDKELDAAGWLVQHANAVNLAAGQGVAVREFILKPPHGRVDYLLFVDRRPVGTIEAKPSGTTLTGVEEQSAKYTAGLPDTLAAPIRPLPFAYEATGVETRFTHTADPEPRSRQLFWFHRPETFARWVREITKRPAAPTLRHRLRAIPPLNAAGLWFSQPRCIAHFGKP